MKKRIISFILSINNGGGTCFGDVVTVARDDVLALSGGILLASLVRTEQTLLPMPATSSLLTAVNRRVRQS